MEKQKSNSLFVNITRVLTANFWVAIIGFIGSFIFPKILTIDSYALYHTFTLYVSYIGILHLGFPSGLAIKYAGKNYKTIKKSQYKSEITLLFTVLISFTLFGLILFLYTKNIMVGYITLAIIPVCLIASYKSLFQAWNKFKEYTRISTTVATAVPLVALIYYFILRDLTSNIYILIYLAVYWIVTLMLIINDNKSYRGIKRAKILSKENWKTEKIGVAFMLGNYVNTLFVSADKQFVSIFFGTTEFAYYSFGMSMQALMTVFITSISQPLFPAMAQEKIKDFEYNEIKNLLIIFGSFSGCAYFATSIIIKLFIQKYVGSLEVVGIYFVVFPAMAVINCLYINLYKIKGLMKKYIYTLVGILIVAIVLNAVMIWTTRQFTGVAIATTITYYIWFFVGFRQFKFLDLRLSDVLYLIVYTVGFFIITRSLNDYIGIVVYFAFINAIAIVFYHNSLYKFIVVRICHSSLFKKK